jgi:hypothetical protein
MPNKSESDFLKVFVGLRRVATQACEGILAGDTVEVVKFESFHDSNGYLGVEQGFVEVKNIRTGKVSSHGACLLSPDRHLFSIAPTAPKPPRAAPKFQPRKLRDPKLRIRITEEDIVEAAKAIATSPRKRTECCVVARATTRALRQRFRRYDGIHAEVGYNQFSVRDANDQTICSGVNLPPAGRDAILAFDRWTHKYKGHGKPSPVEFEVDLTDNWETRK